MNYSEKKSDYSAADETQRKKQPLKASRSLVGADRSSLRKSNDINSLVFAGDIDTTSVVNLEHEDQQ